jgi:hypothetical protein
VEMPAVEERVVLSSQWTGAEFYFPATVLTRRFRFWTMIAMMMTVEMLMLGYGVAEHDRDVQTLPSNGIDHSMLPQSRTPCQGPFFAAALKITNCST